MEDSMSWGINVILTAKLYRLTQIQRNVLKYAKLFYCFSLVFLFILLFNVQANAKNTILIPAAPRVAAKSYILIDYNSGKVLANKNADEKLSPASLTKIMTVYVIFRELKMDT